MDMTLHDNGSDDLSPYEVELLKAYEDRGRADLADCARKGKKYQRLHETVGLPSRSWMAIRALIISLTGNAPAEGSLEEWLDHMRAKFAGDIACLALARGWIDGVSNCD